MNSVTILFLLSRSVGASAMQHMILGKFVGLDVACVCVCVCLHFGLCLDSLPRARPQGELRRELRLSRPQGELRGELRLSRPGGAETGAETVTSTVS